MITGHIRPPKSGEKYHGLLRVDNINSLDPETARRRSNFDGNTAEFPDQLIDLETDPKNLSMRLMNMVAPVGRGQRGLIVSPPKAGKTTVLKQIANAITAKYDDIHIMVVLIGERPEEVTDMQRNIQGEVVHSTFDEPVEEHGRVAEMAMERAKRLVEVGQHVVLLLDSLTRLTRAYNLSSPSSGRTLSGGMDPVALYPAKRFFGAARNTAEGGSLTILATCLVETGSRMDDVIYEGGWPYNTDKDSIDGTPLGERIRVDDTMGRFIGFDQHGDEVDLYDFAGQGRPIMLDTSALDCGPCQGLALWVSGAWSTGEFSEWMTGSASSLNAWDVVPEAVENGDIYWITIMYQSYQTGAPTGENGVASWEADFPHENIPILTTNQDGSDTSYEGDDGVSYGSDWQAQVNCNFYPFVTLFDEDLALVKNSSQRSGWTAPVDRLVELLGEEGSD